MNKAKVSSKTTSTTSSLYPKAKVNKMTGVNMSEDEVNKSKSKKVVNKSKVIEVYKNKTTVNEVNKNKNKVIEVYKNKNKVNEVNKNQNKYNEVYKNKKNVNEVNKNKVKSKERVIRRKEPLLYEKDPSIMTYRLGQFDTPPPTPPPVYKPRPKSLGPAPLNESSRYGKSTLPKKKEDELGYIYFYVPYDKKKRAKMLTPSDGIHMKVIDQIVEKRLKSKSSKDRVNLSEVTSTNSVNSTSKKDKSSGKKTDLYHYMQLPLKSEIEQITMVKFKQQHHKDHVFPSRYPKIPLAPSKMIQISRSIEAKVNEMQRAQLKKEQERLKQLKKQALADRKAKSKLKNANANVDPNLIANVDPNPKENTSKTINNLLSDLSINDIRETDSKILLEDEE